MSKTPELSKRQLWQSHQVNCNVCGKFSEAKIVEVKPNSGIWDTTTTPKAKRFLCRVGAKLLSDALKEDYKPQRHFSRMHFPFVPKLYEEVMANIPHKGWVRGKVVDKSLSAAGRAMGYEIEIINESILGMPPTKSYFYVNQSNITRAAKDNKKPKVHDFIQGEAMTIVLGENEPYEGDQSDAEFVEAIERNEAFRLT